MELASRGARIARLPPCPLLHRYRVPFSSTFFFYRSISCRLLNNQAKSSSSSPSTASVKSTAPPRQGNILKKNLSDAEKMRCKKAEDSKAVGHGPYAYSWKRTRTALELHPGFRFRIHHGSRLRHSASYMEDDDEDEDSEKENFNGGRSQEFHSADNVAEWKSKLHAFIRNSGRQEIVSMEKKDRRDYMLILPIAKELGLHSQNYGKAIVFSKVPLQHYRPDLDQNRPARKVAISPLVHRKVDELLRKHLCEKRMREHQEEGSHQLQSNASSSVWNPERRPVPEHILQMKSKQLLDKQHAWQNSLEGEKMMAIRNALPAYKQREALLEAVANNQVLVVSGETGCGKTTQLPQYILESEIEAGRGASCSIICTQPRRISAMSVAERVAAERGEQLGDSVGYKVRLEGSRGKDTRLLFCTTGILLRRLLVDPSLTGVSHVLVDEIHERGMNEDFLLIVLKDILPRRPDLRIILMSATLNAELFSNYFNAAPTCHIPGFTHPVKAHFLEDILEFTGHRLTEYNQIDNYGEGKSWKMQKQLQNRKRKTTVNSLVEDALVDANFWRYSHSTQDSLSQWSPEGLGFNLIQAVLCHICRRERPGAVLVFMTGWEDITAVKDKFLAHPLLGDRSRVLVLPCHGGMASAEQRLIFDHAPPNVRKIVLATNMAETSITINDVVFVVDCGKAKETSYDALNDTPCLLPAWISQASARQRRGRAGRVQPGEAYHLYPKAVYDAFAEYQLPELHRTPLHSLCLQIKSLRLGSIEAFLSKAMQPPDPLSVSNAIQLLKTIGALDENEELTHLGTHLSMLPVEPTIGKMLFMGSIFGCLEPALTIAAALSLKDPFVSPFNKKDLAEQKRFDFGAKDCSDHMAYVRAYDGWRKAVGDGIGNEFCWDNFLSSQSMEAMHSLRRQFKDVIRESGFIDELEESKGPGLSPELLGGVICSGLFPRVAAVLPKKNNTHFRTVEDGEVLLNQNSLLSKMERIPYPWLVFNEKYRTGIVIIKDSTAVSDTMLLLFGGIVRRGQQPGQLLMYDGWLEFYMSPSLAQTILQLKLELDALVSRKMGTPKLNIYDDSKHLLEALTSMMDGDENLGAFMPAKSNSLLEKKRDVPCSNDVKGVLNNWLSQEGQAAPTYQVKGPKKNMFQARVKCKEYYFVGKPAKSKREAERNAAAEAVEWLNKNYASV